MSSTSPIIDGDTAIAVVYRLTDVDGRIWRSSPYLLAGSMYWTYPPDSPTSGVDSRIRIPTLRHLMAGTQAEIELYIGQVDLQLFAVYQNDPTVAFIDVLPCEFAPPVGSAFDLLQNAVAAAGVGETLYTTGGALENAPPPIARCVYGWRNRVFVANENVIWPSQELATGLGVAWNEITQIRWDDGTGDILAIGHIDWNYLAMFKRDAIGILSGPGPDGMGSGNYIAQTLSTKAGCTNPKSIVNGADGVYYQDAQTGRLMMLDPTLQVHEVAPGAFDLFAAGAVITCALHVEASRQVWFYAAATGTTVGTIIVLDYKHRTEKCPLGAVYTWSTLHPVSAMEIIGGVPHLFYNDGSEATQIVGRAYDQPLVGDAVAYLMTLETADMNPIGLQRQFDLCKVQLLGEFASAHGVNLTVTVDFGAATSTATQAVTAAPEQVSFRPANCQRIQAVRFKASESLYSTIVGPGLKFIGFALEVQDWGKIADVSTGRII